MEEGKTFLYHSFPNFHNLVYKRFYEHQGLLRFNFICKEFSSIPKEQNNIDQQQP